MRRPRLLAGWRNVLGRDGRWVRPGSIALGVLAAALVAVTAGGLLALRWATATASPARTLALATRAVAEPLPLDSALEVTWTWSVGGTGNLEGRWLTLVAPTLPPGICAPARVPGSGEPAPADDPGAGRLDAALELLDQAVVRGAGAAELERRLLALRDAGTGGPGSRTDFLVRYNLARGYGAAADWATAAEVLDPALAGWISLERVPETDRSRAAASVAAGRVDEGLALDAVHGRYLAGTIAYRRGEAERAVAWFRRSINAVHYLLAVRRHSALGPDGHDQRVVAGLGAARCPGLRADEALTSLDAYAGLVAAYMADEGFRDPAGLPSEVARTRLQIDPDDPFAPVLEHARRTRGDPGGTPVPENLLWAASNLQRVYHHNRLRPEPRLEVTRAVLLLHLTGNATWVAALEEEGGAEVCSMLGGIGEDLRSDAQALGLDTPAPDRVDSARAAVAVQTFARLQRDCPGETPPIVDPGVRSAWIRLGGAFLTRGVGGAYEELRTLIAATLRASGASVPVLEERLDPAMERIRAHRRALRKGRVPAELPADLPVEPVGRFVEEWWRAVWVDVAEALAGRVRGADGDGAPVRAGDVPRLLTALESAVAHAGLRPRDVYGLGETASLAATGGRGSELAWRVRTWMRNRPGSAAAGLAALVVALGGLAVLAHVSVWRYRLLVGPRLYREESRAVSGSRRAA